MTHWPKRVALLLAMATTATVVGWICFGERARAPNGGGSPLETSMGHPQVGQPGAQQLGDRSRVAQSAPGQQDVGERASASAAIVGTVLSPEGEPLEGAAVSCSASYRKVQRTDVDGGFALEIPVEFEGVVPLRVLAEHAAFVPTVVEVSDVEERVEIRLGRGSSCCLVVQSVDRMRLADVLVEACLQEASKGEGIVIGGDDARAMHVRARLFGGGLAVSARTDTFGSACLHGLRAGIYEVVLRHPQYMTARISGVDVGSATKNLGTITMASGLTFGGTVISAVSGLLAEATVEVLVGTASGKHEYRLAKTDESGRFMISGIAAGASTLELRASAEAHRAVVERDVSLEDEDYVVQLEQCEVFDLRLRDAQSRTPLTGAVKVLWTGKEGATLSRSRSWLESVYEERDPYTPPSTVVGGERVYQLSDVPDGASNLEVIKKGYYRHSVRGEDIRRAGEWTAFLEAGEPARIHVKSATNTKLAHRVSVDYEFFDNSGLRSFTSGVCRLRREGADTFIEIDPSAVSMSHGLAVQPVFSGFRAVAAVRVKEPGRVMTVQNRPLLLEKL